MTAILGLNAYHGDAAAALVVDGELVAAAEEERFNRVKHCAGFPALAARWCLEDAGLEPGELDHVAVSRDPRANLGARRAAAQPAPASSYTARRRNAVRSERERRGSSPSARAAGPATCTPSSITGRTCASAFFVSPFAEAAEPLARRLRRLRLGDPRGGRGNPRGLGRVLFPHSLGIFYTALTQWLGFPEYGDEGKVMGLAPYGDRAYLALMRDRGRCEGAAYTLGLDYFTHDNKASR